MAKTTKKTYYKKVKIPKKPKIWTQEEDKILISKAKEYNNQNWSKIASFIKDRTAIQCSARFKRIQPGIIKGSWTKEEDNQLIKLYQIYGKNWSEISRLMPYRTGKQIRDRFLNVLDDSLNREKFTLEEDEKIIKLYKCYGKSWSRIAKRLKGRTGDMVKNRFYSSLKKIVENGRFKGKKFIGKKRGRKSLEEKIKIEKEKKKKKKVLNNNSNIQQLNEVNNNDFSETNNNKCDIDVKKKNDKVKYKNNNKNDSGINTNITINNNNDNNNYYLQNDSSFTQNIVNNIININTLIIQQSNFESTKQLLSQLKNNNSNIIINNISPNDSNDNFFKKNFNKTFNNNLTKNFYNNNYDNENYDDNIFCLKHELNESNSYIKNNEFQKNNIYVNNIEPKKIESLKSLIKNQMTYGIKKDNLISQLEILKELKEITNDKIKVLNNENYEENFVEFYN